MTKKMKGGDGDFLTTLFASGLGAYAAQNSSSMGGLFGKLAKYALVFIAIVVGLYIVVYLFGKATEGFMVPVRPSAEGDEKVVTPAGNVIMY
jgi:hypothetical protein